MKRLITFLAVALSLFAPMAAKAAGPGNMMCGWTPVRIISGTVEFPTIRQNCFQVTLTQDVTSSSFYFPYIGEWIYVTVIQDATGGRSFTPPPQTLNWQPIDTRPFSDAAGSTAGVTTEMGYWDGTYWQIVGAYNGGPTFANSNPCAAATDALSSTFCGGPVPTGSPFSAELIQSNTYMQTLSGSTWNLRGPVTQGDSLLVLVSKYCYPSLSCFATTGTGAITDSFNDTLTYVANSSAGYWGTDAFTATAGQSGYVSFSGTWSSGDRMVAIFEFQDLGAFDSTGSFDSGGTGGIYTASITTLTDNDTLVAVNTSLSSSTGGNTTQIDPGSWTTVPLSHKAFDSYVTFEYATSFAPTAGTYGERILAENLSGLNSRLGAMIFAFKPVSNPRPTYAPPTFRYSSVLDVPLQLQPLYGLSSSLGGSALTAGACASATVAVPGALTSMQASATPETYPGDGFYWNAVISGSGVVTVRVCAAAAGTPAASLYDVRVQR